MSEPYTIRVARPADLPLLPAIERAASTLFQATRYANLDGGEPVSTAVDLDREQVWVAADGQDRPVGFALAHVFETSVHLHELDVHPDHARQGLGYRLVETVAQWARAQGATALTLTTFADVPWNGPFYARLGFRVLDRAALSPALQAVWKEEAATGLPMEQRICMQLDL
jgi:GNAT superfamily N-acetyltransferase